MYHVPAQEDPLLFGDLFSSEWLHDAFVNRDAVALREIQLRGGAQGYAPVAAGGRRTTNDLMLAHGANCQAILMSDDCEIESCLMRRAGRGRLVFAAVTPWPKDPAAADAARQMTTFRRHPFIPGDGFPGGIAELFRLFVVTGTALLETPGRTVALHDEQRARLEQRWAAFTTRRGPLAAVDGATKVAHLLDARGNRERIEILARGDAVPSDRARDAAEAVARAFVQGWRTEGEIMQQVADAHEARIDAATEIVSLEDELRELGKFAVAAADLLHSALDG